MAVARMKEEAAAKNLPPVYRGKWASASAEEVQAAKDAGLDYTYRFRVPKVCLRWWQLLRCMCCHPLWLTAVTMYECSI